MILLTSFVSVETAVEAMKLGAFHFANKPFNLDDIVDDGRARARDDPPAPGSPSASRERGATLQPAAHRRAVDVMTRCGTGGEESRRARHRQSC